MTGESRLFAKQAPPEHVVPVSVYVGSISALMIGTALTTVSPTSTWAAGTRRRAGHRRHQDALRGAVLHAREIHTGLTRIVIVAAFFWLGIMICFLPGRRAYAQLGIQSSAVEPQHPHPLYLALPLLGFHSRTHIHAQAPVIRLSMLHSRMR